ncbi:ATP-dependent RNA helicase DbpA [Aliikangiella sp. G2MR2-5]|uniref:ATP-dependent RNA helicase DbpA n=1 Tax=Aliikangiella sp. G2MR2-5 TaxID=2788943 RepID=UPI0018ABD2AC
MTPVLFSTLPLSKAMLANLKTLDYTAMTPIQQHSLPEILKGNDLIAQAKTGSGKTAAFGIGLLHRLDVTEFTTQALVICPTRELSDQVCNELRRLARAIPNTKITALCGGKPMGGQLASLECAPHIVVGTPGRLLKHLTKGSLRLNHLKTLVLDEADRMLDMGFIDDIKTIIERVPKQRQTLLFSATYPDEIKHISASVQNQPIDVRVESRHEDSDIEQVFFEVEPENRIDALLKLLGQAQPESCIIFCNRKQQCNDVARELNARGIAAKALHGDLDQKDRDRVFSQFCNQSCNILIATDVAARGLDIKDLPMVINFELSHDAEVHVHRIGRTGRAGARGHAYSLFQASEMPKVIAIENECQQSLSFKQASDIKADKDYRVKPEKITLEINGGRKDKLRAGDILGALTAAKQIAGSDIGKIDRFERLSYVAVNSSKAALALDLLNNDKIKGRIFKARRVK